MKNPVISIIIPCYNAEKFIENAIRSCFQQSYEEIEVVVIDDGSKDNSKQVIEKLAEESSKIKPIYQENKGVSAARNAGLDNSTGEFCIFLDADDILLPNTIYNFVDEQKKQNADIVLGLTTLHSKDGTLRSDFNYFEFTNTPMASLIKRWWPVCSAMIRKNDKRWNESLKVWEVEEYFFELLLEYKFSCSFIDHYVSRINDYENEHKISTVYDHYHAANSATYFASIEQRLRARNELNNDIIQALNHNIINFAYQAVRNHKCIDSKVFKSINRAMLRNSPNFKITGLLGWCYIFGVEKGIKWFAKTNKLIRREII